MSTRGITLRMPAGFKRALKVAAYEARETMTEYLERGALARMRDAKLFDDATYEQIESEIDQQRGLRPLAAEPPEGE